MMKTALVASMLVVGLLGNATAMAATYDFSGTALVSETGKTFDDFLTVGTASSTDISTQLFTVNLGNTLVAYFESFQARLFDGANYFTSGSTISAGTYDLVLDYTVKSNMSFVNGTYYAGSVNVSPVPEPGELALMLSGLGLMGYMVRRRQQNRAAA